LLWHARIRSAACCLAAALALTPGAPAAGRPQYGGVLRVELRAASVTLEPRRWKSGSPEFAANQRLAELLFDRLVSLDNYGRFQPQLATDWNHDAVARRWQFTLRQGVKFSDGTALTAADVVASLEPLLPRGMQVAATPTGVSIQSFAPAGDLLEVLASGSRFVYRDDGKGLLRGTGPFVLDGPAGIDKGGSDGPAAQSQHLRFRFNEFCWNGRPYLDAVDVTLGVPPLKALLDLQLGKSDLSELSVETVRRAQQSNLRCWISFPLTLYALRFLGDGRNERERSLREAISLSLDRNAMAGVLLQRQAEPAAAFLPQWLSGYAFLFDMQSNVERAKDLRAKFPANTPGVAQPLRLGVDAGSDLSKLVAERVAVVSKSASRAAGDGPGKAEPDLQLIAWRYNSLSPRSALETLTGAWRLGAPEGGVPGEPDARYALEKKLVEERSLVPLVAVPDFAAVDSRVRNWSPAPWGEWRVADLWLEEEEAPARDSGTKSAAGAKP
jgi:hypothetical protein